MQPAIVRPRGPRISRPADETNPSVARSPRPPRFASAITGAPMVALDDAGLPVDGLDVARVHPHGREVEVGIGARHRAAVSRRPSAKLTVISWRRAGCGRS